MMSDTQSVNGMIHKALRVTPAMESGIAGHICSIAELIA